MLTLKIIRVILFDEIRFFKKIRINWQHPVLWIKSGIIDVTPISLIKSGFIQFHWLSPVSFNIFGFND